MKYASRPSKANSVNQPKPMAKPSVLHTVPA
jgi:hypothetical protein